MRPLGMEAGAAVQCSWSNARGFVAEFDARIPNTNSIKLPEDVNPTTLKVWINGMLLCNMHDYIVTESTIDVDHPMDEQTMVTLNWLSATLVYGGDVLTFSKE